MKDHYNNDVNIRKFKHFKNWAASWQNQKIECAPSEDSDQPGYPLSLIRVFTVGMKKAWVLSYPLSAQGRLWSDWADAQADLSLRWAHSHFVGFVMSFSHVFCPDRSVWKLSIQRLCRLPWPGEDQHRTCRVTTLSSGSCPPPQLVPGPWNRWGMSSGNLSLCLCNQVILNQSAQ